MRPLAVTVALAGGLLVVVAIVAAILSPAAPTQLSRPAYTAMARSIGIGVVDLSGADRQDLLCGHLPPGEVDSALRRIDTDCRVSERMAAGKERLSACTDGACARAQASALVEYARESQAIEDGFAHDLSGDCATFFEIEADYGRDIAAAADRLAAHPDGPLLEDALSRWRIESIAAENAIDREPVLELLAACEPDR